MEGFGSVQNNDLDPRYIGLMLNNFSEHWFDA